MSELVKFSIKRKFSEAVTIILNIIISLAIILLCQIDLIMDLNSETVKCVKLDSTTSFLEKYISQDNINYIVSDQENGTILHYQDGFKLYTDTTINDQQLSIIKQDVSNALYDNYYNLVDSKTQYYLENIYQDIDVDITSVETNNSLVSICLSVIYFLLLSYGNLIGADIVFEKKSRVLELQLTCIDVKEHFKSKIATGYISLLIQIGIVLVSFLIGLGLRYKLDHFQGLISLTNTTDVNTVNISWVNVLLIGLIVLVGIVIVQIIMLVISSLTTNAEQIGTISSLFYIFLLVVYYLLLSKNNQVFYDNDIMRYLTYCPIVSMFVAPSRLIYNLIDIKEIAISIAISVVFLYLLIQVLLPVYKNNLTKN